MINTSSPRLRALALFSALLCAASTVSCAATGQDATPEPDAQVVKTTPPPAPEPEPEPEPTPEVPADCAAYVGTEMSTPAGAEQLQAALEASPLPNGVAMKPGVQLVGSTQRPGEFDAVVRICSEPLNMDTLKEIATAIATETKLNTASELLSTLTVSSWSPDTNHKLKQGETVSTEFAIYTWDAATSGVPLKNNWE